MFGRKVNREQTELEKAQMKAFDEMAEYGLDTPEYAAALAFLERLAVLKKGDTLRNPVDPNTIITASITLLSVLIVVAYEQKHAWISKALTVSGKTK